MFKVDLINRECLSVLNDFKYDPFFIDVVYAKKIEA